MLPLLSLLFLSVPVRAPPRWVQCLPACSLLSGGCTRRGPRWDLTRQLNVSQDKPGGFSKGFSSALHGPFLPRGAHIVSRDPGEHSHRFHAGPALSGRGKLVPLSEGSVRRLLLSGVPSPVQQLLHLIGQICPYHHAQAVTLL